nr:hypothetical protein CFP56_56165 [Quercus suber]
MGALVSMTLDSNSWIQAHRYVLFNCEEITPFCDLHIAEIKAGFPFHVTDVVIQKQHIEKFCSWFREYTLTLEMGRQKTKLGTCSKSATLERASSQDVDEIESEKNKDRRSKHDDLHTTGSCAFAVHAAKKAKIDGRPVEHAVLYPILHTCKDGSIVNHVVKAKMSSDISGSIAWLTDDVFAKVMGKERKGRIRGAGFGPSPSGRSSKSALTDIEINLSQARDNEVAQLEASLATMDDKLASFDKMKEILGQFEETEQRMARMLQQM